jgi:hypothetical protein
MAESTAAEHRYNDVVFALPSWPEIYVTENERTMTFGSAQARFGQHYRDRDVKSRTRPLTGHRDTETLRISTTLRLGG